MVRKGEGKGKEDGGEGGGEEGEGERKGKGEGDGKENGEGGWSDDTHFIFLMRCADLEEKLETNLGHHHGNRNN